MATFTPGAADGVSDGTTDVEMVAAPAASTTREVRFATVYNADTVDVAMVMKKVNGASERIMYRIVMPPNSTWEYEGHVQLVATDESIELVLESAVTTNEVQWTASWADLA